jgi:hypothetical protein
MAHRTVFRLLFLDQYYFDVLCPSKMSPFVSSVGEKLREVHSDRPAQHVDGFSIRIRVWKKVCVFH